jgi:hypothetical protein
MDHCFIELLSVNMVIGLSEFYVRKMSYVYLKKDKFCSQDISSVCFVVNLWSMVDLLHRNPA